MQTDPTVAQAVISFEPIQAQIENWRALFLPMRVQSSQDKQGCTLVHDARMEVKAARVSVEKRRKELKADALEYGRRVDEAARKITEQLEPIEKHLQEQEDIVVKEQARLKAEAERVQRERTEARMKQLAAVQCTEFSVLSVHDMPEDQWASFLGKATKQYEERVAAQAAQKALQREEREKLAREREELERQRREQAEREAKLREQERAVSTFAGMPVVVDPRLPPGTVFKITPDAKAGWDGQATIVIPDASVLPRNCPTCGQPWPSEVEF